MTTPHQKKPRPRLQAFAPSNTTRSNTKWIALLLLLGVTSLSAFNPLAGQIQTTLTQSPPRRLNDLKVPSVPFVTGPVIPGLRQGAVPQGIAYVRKHEKIIISHYLDHTPSVISILDNSTGTITASIALKESPTQFHSGHVGGTAVLAESLWVASDEKLLQFDLEPLLSNHPPNIAIPVAVRSTETNASFCTATADTLFVGEFAFGKRYPTKRSHHLTDRKGIKKRAWVCGYSADNLQGNPSMVLSIRQQVQGMHVTKERIFLSLSYGRRNRSTIVIYKNPLGENPHSHVALSDRTSVPLWFLDGENFLKEIDFPPMAEGITMIGSKLAVLAESGAEKFQFQGMGPLDCILLLDVDENE